jgi:hypothetical protein
VVILAVLAAIAVVVSMGIKDWPWPVRLVAAIVNLSIFLAIVVGEPPV